MVNDNNNNPKQIGTQFVLLKLDANGNSSDEAFTIMALSATILVGLLIFFFCGLWWMTTNNNGNDSDYKPTATEPDDEASEKEDTPRNVEDRDLI